MSEKGTKNCNMPLVKGICLSLENTIQLVFTYPVVVLDCHGGGQHPGILFLRHDWLRGHIPDPEVTVEKQGVVNLREGRTILKLLLKSKK